MPISQFSPGASISICFIFLSSRTHQNTFPPPPQKDRPPSITRPRPHSVPNDLHLPLKVKRRDLPLAGRPSFTLTSLSSSKKRREREEGKKKKNTLALLPLPPSLPPPFPSISESSSMKSSNATASSTCNANYNNNPTLPSSSSSSSSSFLNLPQPRPPPPTSSCSSSSFFDPLPSYFPAFQYSPSNPNPNPNPNPSSSTIPPQQQQPQQPPPPSRPSSSKKRSRASRRAPTTVLTTDTSNFRAMVQEFTGFPAPPFASPSSASSPYSFLSRPFPQKQLPTPSSLVDAIAATAAASGGGGGAGAFPMFANPGLIGIHSSVLGPPQPPPPPQYGDLGGFVAAAPLGGVQQGHESHVGRSWQEFGGEGGGDDRQEKRQKAGDGVVDSWIHSSE